VYKKLPEFNFQSKLSTWIAQISYNTCIDYLRKKKLVLLNDLPDEADEPVTHHDTTLRNDLAGILQTEMNKLPPLYKTLITLFHNQDMSYAEIGDITGLPEGTVKSYLFRARKALKNNLMLTYKKEDL
jgi:RNA polymerase sigma factor (sigma-70 family)